MRNHFGKFRFWLKTVWTAAQLILEARRHSQRNYMWPCVIWLPKHKLGEGGEPELSPEEWRTVIHGEPRNWPHLHKTEPWPADNYGTLWWDRR